MVVVLIDALTERQKQSVIQSTTSDVIYDFPTGVKGILQTWRYYFEGKSLSVK